MVDRRFIDCPRPLMDTGKISFLNTAINFVWSHAPAFREHVFKNLTEDWCRILSNPFHVGSRGTPGDVSGLLGKPPINADGDCLAAIEDLITASGDAAAQERVTKTFWAGTTNRLICNQCQLDITTDGSRPIKVDRPFKLSEIPEIVTSEREHVSEDKCLQCNNKRARLVRTLKVDTEWLTIVCSGEGHKKTGAWVPIQIGAHFYEPFSAIVCNGDQSRVWLVTSATILGSTEYCLYGKRAGKFDRATKATVTYAIQLTYERMSQPPPVPIPPHLPAVNPGVQARVPRPIPRAVAQVQRPQKKGLCRPAQAIVRTAAANNNILVNRAHNQTKAKGAAVVQLIIKIEDETRRRYTPDQVNAYIRNNIRPLP